MSAISASSPETEPSLSILESVNCLLKTDFLLVSASVGVLLLGGCDSLGKRASGLTF